MLGSVITNDGFRLSDAQHRAGSALRRRWIEVSATYGPRKAFCNRFVRWSAKGVWKEVPSRRVACRTPASCQTMRT
jgi:transposase